MPSFELYDHVNEALKENIKLHSPNGEPQSNFIYSLISENAKSKFYMQGLCAYDYFYNEADINKKVRQILGKNGTSQITDKLANTKKQHNFLYKLIKQKRSFLLSKDFIINSLLDLSNDENKEYMNDINKRFNDVKRKFLKNVVTDSMLYGIAWVQKYYDEDGNLKFKKIPSLEVIPLWKDSEHTILDAVIRHYKIDHYNDDGSKEVLHKIEFYDESGVWYYEEDTTKGKLVPDKDIYKSGGFEPLPNFYKEKVVKDEFGQSILDENGNELTTLEGQMFEDIPFIAVKYNEEEMPLLSLVKSLIDEYNNISSLCGDELKDVNSSILKVKGYSGKDADTFLHNLNNLRAVFLQSDGDLDTLSQNIDITSMDSYLDRTKEDIYDLSMSVNSQAENLQNASGVALDLRFRDLILDCSDLGNEVEDAIIKMIEAINIDKLAKGEFVPDTEYDVVFNMDLPTDETSVISNVKNSVGVISNRTILSNHPWVNDVDYEVEQMENEKTAENSLTGSLFNSYGTFGSHDDIDENEE